MLDAPARDKGISWIRCRCVTVLLASLLAQVSTINCSMVVFGVHFHCSWMSLIRAIASGLDIPRAVSTLSVLC